MPNRVIAPLDAWRASPAGFAARVYEKVWPRHLRLLSYVLVLVATGHIRRLTVSLPPGHAKSEATLRTFPAWLLDLWPDQRLIGASYGASLAVAHGRVVRDTILGNQDILRVRFGGSSSVDEWYTTAGGGMITAGRGGSITGRRAHGGLCDDLHKDYDDAHSVAGREHVWNFWTGTMRPRLFPAAWQIIVGTRWHEEDIIGRVITGDENSLWVPLVLPALAEGDEELDHVLGWNNELGYSPICEKLRKDGLELPTWRRAAGEALWPTNYDPQIKQLVPWYDHDELSAIRADILEYKWAALYQQHPAPPQGEMFPASRWDRHDAVPPRVPLVRYWDLAASEGGGDESVGLLMCRDEHGYTYVVDVVHGRWSDSQVEEQMKRTAVADVDRYGRHRVKTVFEQEPGSGGKAWARRIQREVLAGFRTLPDRPTGDKQTRARGVAAQVQAGFVRLVRRVNPATGDFGPAPWFDLLIEQARVFPNGKHDDLVDALSGAFNQLVGTGSRRARVRTAAGVAVPS